MLKQGMLGGDRLRTHAARLSEALEDLMAEVHVEVAQELEGRSKADLRVKQAVASAVEAGMIA